MIKIDLVVEAVQWNPYIPVIFATTSTKRYNGSITSVVTVAAVVIGVGVAVLVPRE